ASCYGVAWEQGVNTIQRQIADVVLVAEAAEAPKRIAQRVGKSVRVRCAQHLARADDARPKCAVRPDAEAQRVGTGNRRKRACVLRETRRSITGVRWAKDARFLRVSVEAVALTDNLPFKGGVSAGHRFADEQVSERARRDRTWRRALN